MLLQLEPSFDIRALEVLVTPEVVEVAIAEAKAKVATEQEVEVGEEDIAEERLVVEVVASREGIVEDGPTTEEAIQELTVRQSPDGVGKETETTRATLEDKAS